MSGYVLMEPELGLSRGGLVNRLSVEHGPGPGELAVKGLQGRAAYVSPGMGQGCRKE